MRQAKCERCPNEHTKECDTCYPVELSKVGIEEAIKYLREENEAHENALGDRAKELFEYRINKIAIEALEEKLLYGSRIE